MMISRARFFVALALLFVTVQSSQAQLFGKIRSKLFCRSAIQHADELCCNQASNQPVGSPGPIQPPRTCREQYTQDVAACDKLKDPKDKEKCLEIAASRLRRCPPLGEFNPRPIETVGMLEITPEQCLENYNACMQLAIDPSTQQTTPEQRARCEDIFFHCLRNSTPVAEDPTIPTCELPQVSYSHCEPVRYCCPTPVVKRFFKLRCR
jgi:hypothetical protein